MARFVLCDDNFPSEFDSWVERERWAAYWGACGDLDAAAESGTSPGAPDFECVKYLFYTLNEDGEETACEVGDDSNGLVATNKLAGYWEVVALTKALARRPSFADVFPSDEHWGERTTCLAGSAQN